MYNFEGYSLINKNYTRKEIKAVYTHLRKSIKRIYSRKKMYNALKSISEDLNQLNKAGLHFLDKDLIDVKMLDDETLYRKLNYKKIQKILRDTIPPAKNKSQMLHNIKNLMSLFDYWLEDGDFAKPVEFVESDEEALNENFEYVKVGSNENSQSEEVSFNDNIIGGSNKNSVKSIESSQNYGKNQSFQDIDLNENFSEPKIDLNDGKNQSFKAITSNENSDEWSYDSPFEMDSDAEGVKMKDISIKPYEKVIKGPQIQHFNIKEWPEMNKNEYPQNSDSEDQKFIDKYIYDQYGTPPSSSAHSEKE